MGNMEELKANAACAAKGFFGRDWTFAEKALLLTDCVLLGIVIGAIWSPKKQIQKTFGSYNTGTLNTEGCEEDWEEDEE